MQNKALSAGCAHLHSWCGVAQFCLLTAESCLVVTITDWQRLVRCESESGRPSKYLHSDLSTRSKSPSAPKCPRSTFMQHYQVPSAEYSSYINHVIRLGLAGDYIAQLHGSCSPDSPPSLRAAIDQACRHLSGVVDDLQPVLASAPGVHSLETLGQQNGAPVSDAAVGLAAAMPNTPEEEARILQLTQLINARHGAAKPQNTVQAEKSAAKLWRVGAAWPLLLLLWPP